MSLFNEENTVEKKLIDAAKKCGWKYVEAKDVPTDTMIAFAGTLCGILVIMAIAIAALSAEYSLVQMISV